MKKILYVITKSNWGGAQRYIYDLASSLPNEHYDVVVALGGSGQLKERLEASGVRTIAIPHLERDISLTKELRSLFSLYRIFQRERPDIVHLNSSKAGGLGAFAARLARVPRIIFTAHGWYFHEDRGALVRALTWFLSWLTQLFAHHTIAVSGLDYEHAPLRGQTTTIHNGIVAPSFLPRSEARQQILPTEAKDAPILIGTVAELHTNKGLRYLVEAAARLPETTFCVLGEGEERKRLKELIEMRELRDRFLLVGNVPNAARYLQAFDIFVLPSTKEGFPYTLLEAGAAGVPVIATTVGGIPELIENEVTGLLVEKKNTEALTQALERLIGDEPLRERLGSALKERVEQEFSLEQMVEKTTALYER